MEDRSCALSWVPRIVDPFDGSEDDGRCPTPLAKALRRVRGSTRMVDFAAATGVSQSAVSKWERGVTAPSLEHLAQIEAALGLPAGRIAAEAGFVGPDAFERGGLLAVHYTLDTGLVDTVRSALQLGLGVALRNESVPDPDDPDVCVEEWVVEVYREPLRRSPSGPSAL
jgi:transcriptional regulator with XRE-family HTH domain